MGTIAPRADTLPFEELIRRLERSGFEIDVRHYLRLQLLLDRLGGLCAPQDLKTLLCPIFATDARQQARFYAVFEELYPLFGERRDAAPTALEQRVGRETGSTATPVERLQPTRRPSRSVIIALAALAAAVLLVMMWSSSERGSASRKPESAASARVPQARATTPSPIPAPATPPAPKRISFRLPPDVYARFETPLRVAGVLAPLVVLLLFDLRRREQRRLVIERAREQRPPFVWPVRVERPPLGFVESGEIAAAARELRRRQVGQTIRLDVSRTIAATIEARGFPTLQYTGDTRAPEYLVLIERTGPSDHLARLFSDLTASLRRFEVQITEYLYDRDPRVLSRPEGGVTRLVDARRRFSENRILLFGDGSELLNPVTGTLHSWATELLAVGERALLTPVSPSDWGLRETMLAREFIVLPATVAALGAVVDHFEHASRPDLLWERPSGATRRRDAIDGMSHSTAGPLPSLHAGGGSVAELRRYLGDASFQWLCSCALYPELHWDLTLHLGALPALGGGLLTESNLIRLLRLPWFRVGVIPNEVRLELVANLLADVAEPARRSIAELLQRNPPPPRSVAADRHQLAVLSQQLGLPTRDRTARRERRRLLREVKRIPRARVSEDVVLVRALRSDRSSPLAFPLPKGVQRFMYRDGVRPFGLRSMSRVAVALLVAAIAQVALPRSRAARTPPNGAATAVPNVTVPSLPRLVVPIPSPPPTLANLTRVAPSSIRGRTDSSRTVDTTRLAMRAGDSTIRDTSGGAGVAERRTAPPGVTLIGIPTGTLLSVNGAPHGVLAGDTFVGLTLGEATLRLEGRWCFPWDTTVLVNDSLVMRPKFDCFPNGELGGAASGNYTIPVGAERQIQLQWPAIRPDQAVAPSATSWLSLDTSVVQVSSEGVISARGVGQTHVVARRSDGTTVAITLRVVSEAQPSVAAEVPRDPAQLLTRARDREGHRTPTRASAEERRQLWGAVLANDSSNAEARAGFIRAEIDLAATNESCGNASVPSTRTQTSGCYDQLPTPLRSEFGTISFKQRAGFVAVSLATERAPVPYTGLLRRRSTSLWIRVSAIGEPIAFQGGDAWAQTYLQSIFWAPARKGGREVTAWVRVLFTVYRLSDPG